MKRWFRMLWKMFTDARALGRAERDLARSFEGIPRVDWSEFYRNVDRIARRSAEMEKLQDAHVESLRSLRRAAGARRSRLIGKQVTQDGGDTVKDAWTEIELTTVHVEFLGDRLDEYVRLEARINFANLDRETFLFPIVGVAIYEVERLADRGRLQIYRVLRRGKDLRPTQDSPIRAGGGSTWNRSTRTEDTL